MAGRPPLFNKLVHEELGFCCFWAFFKVHKPVPTGMLAAGLGLSRRTVQTYRQPFRRGEYKCLKCENCLNTRIST